MKSVVLFSGGIDSTTCLSIAISKYGRDSVLALNIYYGQTNERELENAKIIADYYKVKYIRADLSSAFTFSDCSLLKQSNKKIFYQSYDEQIKNIGGYGIISTYVPFRNGLFLSYSATIAKSVGAREIYYGAHRDDSKNGAYPDCSTEFKDAMNKAIYEGTGHSCELVAPFVNKTKIDVIKEGIKLNTPYELTWSCYESDSIHCGKCGTCVERKEAFQEAGVYDPTIYED